jgi:hypothetical protein
MANKKLFVAMLAIALALGMTAVGCAKGSKAESKTAESGKTTDSSASGGTWTAVKDSKLGDEFIYAIAFGNGKFVAGTSHGKMAYSSDGVTWTAVSDKKLGTDRIEGIAFGNGKFVAVGPKGQIAYLSDK